MRHDTHAQQKGGRESDHWEHWTELEEVPKFRRHHEPLVKVEAENSATAEIVLYQSAVSKESEVPAAAPELSRSAGKGTRGRWPGGPRQRNKDVMERVPPASQQHS